MHAYITLDYNRTKKLFFFKGYLNIDGTLTTKDSRTTWEDIFENTHLNPVLSVSFVQILCNYVIICYVYNNIHRNDTRL